ncbi:MAG TPA: type IV toxin-antitoxin system AbiEi family antitoxin domain-containing protein [Solirubrobacteraceae bacterium]|nr:type IV toxin-antitoxin system AbiEi family antitoxin domain-containing protein [Solirubrobacteraceae bacterium]
MGRNTGHSCKSSHDPERERQILALAGRQHGHVTRTQLLALGLHRGAITARLESERYIAVHHGVYCIGPRRHDPISRAAAAVLACGPDALLSHASAASLWGFLARWSFPLHVTVRGDRKRPGITVHRCPSLDRSDSSLQQGVRVTAVARTVLDIAPTLSHKQLTRVVNDARRDGHLRLAALSDVLSRNPRHPGTKLLRPFLEDPRNPTDSPFEDDFLAFVKRYGLPVPQTNVWLHGRKVDVFYPEANLIVELDGRGFHSDPDAFRDDRERDAENLKHGLTTLRMTTDRLELTPGYEAERLMAIYRRATS